jgi:predicted Zn-dependent protease
MEKEKKPEGGLENKKIFYWAAGFVLAAGILLGFTPLGKALRDWWIARQDQRLYGEACQAWDAGRFDEAKGDCERIVQNEPAFDGALVLLGKYYAEKAAPPDWNQAADYESRALKARKDFATLLAYGGSLWKLKKYAESENVLRDCLGQKPDDSEVYDQLGWVLVCEKNYGEAARVYGEGLKLDPGNARMRGWRHEALKRLSGKG